MARRRRLQWLRLHTHNQQQQRGERPGSDGRPAGDASKSSSAPQRATHQETQARAAQAAKIEAHNLQISALISALYPWPNIPTKTKAFLKAKLLNMGF
ncbi:MAG: ORF3 [Tettorquevirus sp.]|nr:MAG: ORF3 [Tettorquevirus sp.]